MNDNLDDLMKAASPYQELTEQLDKQGESIEGIEDQLKRTNALLSSLNRYHGEPESEAGYLKQIADSLCAILTALVCIKIKITNHMSIGLKVTGITLFFAGVALVTEIASKGEYPIFSATWNYLKGVF